MGVEQRNVCEVQDGIDGLVVTVGEGRSNNHLNLTCEVNYWAKAMAETNKLLVTRNETAKQRIGCTGRSI